MNGEMKESSDARKRKKKTTSKPRTEKALTDDNISNEWRQQNQECENAARAGTSASRTQPQGHVHKKPPKSEAERAKDYRQHKKARKNAAHIQETMEYRERLNNDSKAQSTARAGTLASRTQPQGHVHKKPPKSEAERARAYRQRKKARENAANTQETTEYRERLNDDSNAAMSSK